MIAAPHRVAILGTGALAMLFGARLARSGLRVTLVGTWPEGLDALSRRGVTVEAGGRWRQRVGVAALETVRRRPLPAAVAVLVLVKSHRTAAVAADAARLGSTVVTLQNGLGNAELLARAAGPERVVAGVSWRGATALGPGRVRDGGGGPLTLPAGRPGIALLLRRTGFPVETVADVGRAVWRKLAVNCALNPLTALHAVPNGAVAERAELRARALAAAREVARVARARGLDLGARLEPDLVAAARRTAANRSSMLQDLDRGLPTEIDALCGAVVRAGEAAGVPTPVNRSHWRAVLELERRAAAAAAQGRR